MRDLTAQPATHARFDNGCDGIGAQRVRRRFYSQRRATRKSSARVIASANFVVDAVGRTRDSLTALQLLGVFAAVPPLTRTLAFAASDDHLQTALGCLQCLF